MVKMTLADPDPDPNPDPNPDPTPDPNPDPDPDPSADARPNPVPNADARPKADLVLDLDVVDGSMIDLVGGKAANLGEITAAGLPVPEGFCVTTAAYRLVAARTDLGKVCAALATTSASDTGALCDLAHRARELLAAAPMPPGVADAVVAAYEGLGGGPGGAPVAVRSSATAEDLPTASFAGQQDTFLNVVGTRALLESVHRCWVSLWTDRAVSYRAVNGIDHSTVELAVVIQRMVDAAVAGVLFTADPVTGRRHRVVVDSSKGLGEAVVSGAVNPDRFVVDTPTGRIIERRLGDKRLAVRSLPGGGTEQVVGPNDGSTSLSDSQLLRLVALGSQVERHYGAPQDLEWAIDEHDEPWLTQTRPITTLFPLPATTPKTDDGTPVRAYFCLSLAQGLNRPITPMGLAAFRVLGSGVSDLVGVPVADPLGGPPAVTEAAGRLYLDVTDVIRNAIGRVVFPRMLDVMEARSAVVLRHLLDDPRLTCRPGGRARFARRLATVAVRFRVPLVILEAVARPEATHRRCARLEDGLRDRTRPLPEGATGHERLEAVTRLLRMDIVPMLPGVLPAAAAGFALLALARRLLGEDAGPGDLQTVLRGMPHNVTTTMDLRLWDLASEIQADAAASAIISNGEVSDLAARYRSGTLPAVAQQGLEAFLRRYGHRAVAEIDVGLPRWREDPSHLMGVLANYLRLPPDVADPLTSFRRGAAEAEAMVATLQNRAGRRSRARGAVVGFSLRRTRQLAGLRELPKFLMILAVAGARDELTRIGQGLASAGRIAQAEDVFFLDLHDVLLALRGVDQRVLVVQRREMYDREMGRRHLPRFLLSDGTEPDASTAQSADGALRGTPASAGTVAGPAHVVLDPAGAHIGPGEILVVPSTDPGWTPLFLTAGGLVMEMGGANSHGAVVAREYGIPAVVGVPDATTRIATGQLVRVDGTNGVVLPENDRDNPNTADRANQAF